MPRDLNELMQIQHEALFPEEPGELGGPRGSGTSIQELKHRHVAIMDFMMINPTAQMGEVAIEFNVTRSWLSTVIHSDCFQSELQRKQQAVFESAVLPLHDKMLGVAHLAVERIGEALDDDDVSGDFALQSADLLLKGLGYGSKPSGMQLSIPPGSKLELTAIPEDEILRARRTMFQPREVEEAQILPAPEGGGCVPEGREAAGDEPEGAESSVGTVPSPPSEL